MYAIIAFIPIIVTIVLMVAFNWPAKRALPLKRAVGTGLARIKTLKCFSMVTDFLWRNSALKI